MKIKLQIIMYSGYSNTATEPIAKLDHMIALAATAIRDPDIRKVVLEIIQE